MKQEEFLSAVVQWASEHPDVLAVALVGSYARGAATEASDIDLVVLTTAPERYLGDTRWTTIFGPVDRQQVEDWGQMKSLRVWYADGREVEFGLTTLGWVARPMDEGTRRVISDGIQVLFDPDAYLSAAIGG